MMGKHGFWRLGLSAALIFSVLLVMHRDHLSATLSRSPAAGPGRQAREIERVGLAEVLRALRSKTAEIVDVRQRASFEAGHIPGATSWPEASPQLMPRHLPEIVIVYCENGGCPLSVRAARQLVVRGHVAKIYGEGWQEWALLMGGRSDG